MSSLNCVESFKGSRVHNAALSQNCEDELEKCLEIVSEIKSHHRKINRENRKRISRTKKLFARSSGFINFKYSMNSREKISRCEFEAKRGKGTKSTKSVYSQK